MYSRYPSPPISEPNLPPPSPSIPRAAAEVLFSTDFGRCWQTVPLSVALYVSNIGIEPDGQRPRVILTGVTCPQNVHELCSDAPKGASGRSKVPSGVMYVVDVKVWGCARVVVWMEGRGEGKRPGGTAGTTRWNGRVGQPGETTG
eukprot:363618-Chlamydomonas_euryale.AAC.2